MFNRPKKEMQGVTSCEVSHGITLTAGAAGALLSVQLPEFPILNSEGGQLASYTDTSLSFSTGTTLTNEVAANTADADLANGDYWVDYTTGFIRGRRADNVASDTAVYTVLLVKTAEALKPVAEDNTNGVLAIANKKLANSTYAAILFSNYSTSVTANVKASPGNVMSIWGDNDNAATRYLQVHNTAGTPSAAAVPLFEIKVPANSGFSFGEEMLGLQGVHCLNGIAYAWSTTSGTYTAATAGDHVTFIRYV